MHCNQSSRLGDRRQAIVNRACLIAISALLAGCAGAPPSVFTTSATSGVAAPKSTPMATPTLAAVSSWAAVRNLGWPDEGQTENRGYGSGAKADFWNIQAAGAIEVYCQKPFNAAAARAKKIGVNKLNIEHVAPADRIAEALRYQDRDCNRVANASLDPKGTCKYAIADLHNMWPAYSSLNSSRQKLRYAEIDGEDENRRFEEFCPDYEYADKRGETFVEPTDDARGNLARSLIYMSIVYKLPLDLAIDDRDTLLEWNRDDPPDADEKRREAKIRQIQGTWNPLVMPH